MLLDKAETRVTDIIAAIADTPGVRRLEPAGSFRRRKESIGDLDVLAETDDAASAHRAVHRPRRRRPRRQPGRLQGGGAPHARPAGGPDDHAARRGRDLPRPLHGLEGAQRPAPRDGPRPGLEPVREGLPAHRRGRRAADRRRGRAADVRRPRPRPTRSSACRSSSPSCARTRGEIEAALAGRLPTLITQADLRGDLHSHSDWSDGTHAIEVMAEAARRRGYAYQVLTDHSQSLAIARGLTPGAGRGAARDRRDAQRAVRRRGGGGHRAAGDPARRLPAAPRLRAGDPGRRPARLSRTTCSRASTSSSRRCTSRGASRGPS